MLKILKIGGADKLDLNSSDGLHFHRRIIQSKKIMLQIYKNYYQQIFTNLDSGKGKIYELGAGAYNGKNFYFPIITTDVIQYDGIDRVLDAQNMDLAKDSAYAFIMVNTLHHLPDVEKFFNEAVRTLQPEGKIVMIEPFFSLWGKFLYKNFHHEPSVETVDWKIENFKGGRLTDANQMIPYMIFFRDRKIFEQKFPQLEIQNIQFHNFLSYALSGGLSYKQLIPNFLLPLLWRVEKLAFLFPHIFATSMTVTISKK